MAPKNQPVIGITEERVSQMISEAIKNLVSLSQLETNLDDLIKRLSEDPFPPSAEERVKVIVAEELAATFKVGSVEGELIEGESLHVGLTDEHVKELISEALLKLRPAPGELVTLPDGTEGKLFDDSLLNGLEIDGRPMTTDDILSGTKSDDGVVTIVTRDGKKHVITRK